MNDPVYERAAAFSLLRGEADGDGLTLEGYAAVFNSPTMINDWDGEYEEVIAPGAFKRTIAGGNPVLQFEHGRHPLFGSMPIGTIHSLEEDTRGLYVKARLFDNWLTEPLRHAITDGAVDGMSFRFEIIKETWERSRDPHLRTVKEVRMHELGPVVFPAYKETTVALRSLAAVCPGFTVAADPPTPGTPEEPAATRSTSDGPAASTDDPADATRPPTPSTADERKQRGRQITTARLGVRKK
jgi:HK97 family phage prohead protease